MANPTTRREHVGAATAAGLVTSMSVSDLAFSITTNTGWPTGGVGSFFVVIDPGTASEEKVLCSGQSSGLVSVASGGRGADGTTARAHNISAVVYPIWAATEADELNLHAASVNTVHGVTGSVVGTTDAQALTNKSLDATNTVAKAAVTGAPAGAFVGTTDSQTLTNKIISGASNTLSNIAESAITNLSADLAALATRDTNLETSNPQGAGHGQVFIAAGATAGTAINAAITSFGATKGIVQLGKGTHTLDAAVVLTDNVTIRGMGRSSTFVVFDPSTIPVAFSAGTTAVSNCVMSDMRIQTSTSGTGVAIDYGYVNYGRIEHLDVGAASAYPNKAIDFSINNLTNRPYYNVIRDCNLNASGANPVVIDMTNQVNSCVIDNVRVNAPSATGTPRGVVIGGSVKPTHQVLIMHLDCESITGMVAVDITDTAYAVTLVGCYFESIAIAIRIAAGAANIKGYGCLFFAMSTAAVQDAGASDVTITGSNQAIPYAYRSAPAPIVFTASGSLTAAQAAGAVALRIRGVNGGGGSGGAAATTAATNSSGSGSGGGGAGAEKTIATVGLTFPLQVSVGAAGTAGATTPAAGGKGGQSIVKDNNGAGSTLWTPGVQATNQGGGAGAAAATLGVAAGVGGFDSSVTGSVADFVVLGSGGQNSYRVATTAAGGAVMGVPGGSSMLGGAAAANSNATGQGVPGLNYGGGGASVQNGGTAVALAGVAGAGGIVIVELIFAA